MASRVSLSHTQYNEQCSRKSRNHIQMYKILETGTLLYYYYHFLYAEVKPGDVTHLHYFASSSTMVCQK